MTIQLEKLVASLEINSQGFKAPLLAAAAGITAVVAGIGIAAKATFDWANDLDSLGDVMDGTNKDFAALAFVARKSGVGVDAVSKANVLLNKSLLKADGSLDLVGKKLKEYGIDVKDANGNVKDSIQLTDEIAEKYAALSTQQERVNFLTELYGKSGAQMIDFFDTLVADGGIDKVTEKVEALGLAIDPDRYEKFNRNLEELKLVGLGLAVSFTEKIMPAIEGFLGILSNPKSINIGKIASWAENTISTWMVEMARSVEKWVNGGGPEKLSERFISWVENIGKGEKHKSKILIAATRLFEALREAISNIDWQGMADAIDKKNAESISSHDWNASGQAFGNAIDEFFNGGNKFAESKVSNRWLLKIALPGVDALITFFQSEAAAAFGEAVVDFFEGAIGEENLKAWDTFVVRGDEKMAEFFGNTDKWLAGVDKSFANWSVRTWGGITKWGSDIVASANASMSELKEGIDRKLSAISEQFQRRAGAWLRKAADAVTEQKNTLLGAIQAIVDEINSILKQIKTSFHISFSFGTSSQGVANTSSLGGGTTGTGGGGGGGSGGRATGGPVLANKTYPVVELMKPERFTPFTAGRIDPIKSEMPREMKIARDSIQELKMAIMEGVATSAG